MWRNLFHLGSHILPVGHGVAFRHRGLSPDTCEPSEKDQMLTFDVFAFIPVARVFVL